jgi:hypothetical protein
MQYANDGGMQMTHNNKDRGRSAPYVSAASLSSFFDHVRWVSTPKKVDQGLLLDYGLPKGSVGALLSALKFFGLVEGDGTPTPAFKMIQTGGDEFRKNLEQIVKRSYGDLFSRLDPSRDSREKIRNYFARNFSPAISNKATILFLDLAKEAGIPVAEEPPIEGRVQRVSRVPRKPKRQPSEQSLPQEAPKFEHKPPIATLSDEDLQRMYIKRLIEGLAPPDTGGKDAEAIEADAKLYNAQLERIERLLKIGKESEVEESAEEVSPEDVPF